MTTRRLALRPVGSLSDVLMLCERGRAALASAVTVTDAREGLAVIATLEHAIKVRDLNQEAVVAASTLRICAERRVGELLARRRRTRAVVRNLSATLIGFPPCRSRG